MQLQLFATYAREHFAIVKQVGEFCSRPVIAEKRLSLTPHGNVRYQLKTRTVTAQRTPSSSRSISLPGWRRWYPSRGAPLIKFQSGSKRFFRLSYGKQQTHPMLA